MTKQRQQGIRGKNSGKLAPMSGSKPQRRKPGALLNVGVTSEVFAYGSDAVVKILKPGIPAEWAEIEATNTALVHGAGVPTAEVLETGLTNGRPSITFRRVRAPTMAEAMLGDPPRVPALAELMANLQRDIQATSAPQGLVPLRRRVQERIAAADVTSVQVRDGALEVLASLDDGTALCHGDFHPGNILLGTDGPVVIDWFDAAVGSGLGDVVRSSLLLRLAPDSAVSLPHLPGAPPGLIAAIHDAYVTAALSGSGGLADIMSGTIRSWEIVLAVARLAESVPPAGLIEIWSQRNEALTNSPLLQVFSAVTSGRR